MRCPNCFSEIGNSRGYCPYCGYDLGGDNARTAYVTGPGRNWDYEYYYQEQYLREMQRQEQNQRMLTVCLILLAGILAFCIFLVVLLLIVGR